MRPTVAIILLLLLKIAGLGAISTLSIGRSLWNGRNHSCSQYSKLVINSHVNYGKVLNVLLKSLVEQGFDDWRNVLVVRGGADRDVAPYRGERDMAFVDTTLNSFDYHAFAILYRYSTHPLVRADSYFYLLDSSTVGPCFPGFFQNLCVAPRELVTSGAWYTSNIAAFGNGVVADYRHNFDKLVDKVQGLLLEAGYEADNGVRPLGKFAHPWTALPLRKLVGSVDLYHTGHPRRKYWYPEFDVYKYILWGEHGDVLNGDVQPNRVGKIHLPPICQGLLGCMRRGLWYALLPFKWPQWESRWNPSCARSVEPLSQEWL